MTREAMIKEIHHIVEEVNDERLEEIYQSLQSSGDREKYSAAELAEIYRRVALHKKGQNPTFSVEEAHNYVRQNAKKG